MRGVIHDGGALVKVKPITEDKGEAFNLHNEKIFHIYLFICIDILGNEVWRIKTYTVFTSRRVNVEFEMGK